MRQLRMIVILALAAPALSGCYALEYALFGPGYCDGGHRGHHARRDRYRDHDRDRDRSRRDRRGPGRNRDRQ